MWALLTALFCSFLVCFHLKFIISLIENTLVQYDLLFQYHFPIRQILEPLYLNIILLEKIDAISFLQKWPRPCALVCLCTCILVHLYTLPLCKLWSLRYHLRGVRMCDCAIVQLCNCAIVDCRSAEELALHKSDQSGDPQTPGKWGNDTLSSIAWCLWKQTMFVKSWAVLSTKINIDDTKDQW